MNDTPSPLRLDGDRLYILDQTLLPFARQEVALETAAQAARAIATMQVRGAPLIGAIGAFGLALALREAAGDAALDAAVRALGATRPTAVNLAWALHRVATHVRPLPPDARAGAAWREALAICDEDRAANRRIGELTLELMQAVAPRGPAAPRTPSHLRTPEAGYGVRAARSTRVNVHAGEEKRHFGGSRFGGV